MDAQEIRQRAQKDPKALEEILTPLVKDPPEGVSSLMRELLDLYRDDKACHKVIRRAIFKLGQKGIKVEVEEGRPPAVLGQGKGEEYRGYLGILDLSGRLFVVLERQSLTGLVGYFAGGSFGEGILDLQRAQTSKKAWRNFLEGLRRPHLPPPVEVPPGYAKAVLEEWAQREGHKDWGRIRRELEGLLLDPQGPLVYRHLPSQDLPKGNPQRDTEALLQLIPFFGLWALDVDEVKPHYEEMRSALSSPLALTEAQKAQRLESIWQKASEKVFTPEVRKALKRGLEELALVFLLGGLREKGEAALRLAGQMDEGPSPFQVHSLFRAILSVAFRALEAEERKEPPLIVRP